MIRFGRLATALAVIAVLSSSTATAQDEQGAPLLFEIEGEKPSYLFGTFSPAFKSTSKLHAQVTEKLGGVDAILEEMSQPSPQVAQKYFFLANNKTLKDVMPAEVYAEVEAQLATTGNTVEELQKGRFKPWYLAIALNQNQFKKEVQSNYGQTRGLMKLILRKPKTGLLTFEEGVGSFAGAELPDQIQMVVDVLGKVKAAVAAGKKPNSDWAEAYVAGDIEAVHAAWVSDMTGENEELNARLIKAMYETTGDLLATKIAERLKRGDKSYGITVGSQYLGGPHSLVKKLEAKGLKLKRIGG